MKNNWELCSLDQYHTTSGNKCKKRCAQNGERYFWCNIDDGDWGYCSPSLKVGVDVSDTPEVTIYGVKCKDKCRSGGSYYWCNQYGGTGSDSWDYCSPASDVTMHNEKCTDICKPREENYNWCHTADSWDYCSPRYRPGIEKQYKSSIFDSVLFWLFGVVGFTVFFCYIGYKLCNK